MLVTLALLAGCSPDGNSSAAAPGTGGGPAATNPGSPGGGTQNSGGGNTDFLALVPGAPDRVALRGTRRVQLNYNPPGVVYTEDVGYDGMGSFSIELIDLVTPHPDPDRFRLLQDQRQVMTFRFRDWLIRDYGLFLQNYGHSVLNDATVVAGRSCVQLDVMSTAQGPQIRYVVDVDPTDLG